MMIFKIITKKLTTFGPAILVTSAFIGPGTITMCTLAGFNFGFSILWALLFSIFSTVILQEMCARLGLITQQGLSEVFSSYIKSPTLRWIGIALVFMAIVIGNSAYEAGNISGAVVGLKLLMPTPKLFSHLNINFQLLVVAGIALILLATGSYKFIEKVLMVLVASMSLIFIITAILLRPDIGALLHGLFIPKIPEGSFITIVGLIGTTVVPYNLFLHSASVKERWSKPTDLPSVKFDTVFSIIIGGIISLAIVVCAAAASEGGKMVEGIDGLSDLLQPTLGIYSKYFVGFGIFAAGISSAITAPLAVGYTVIGLFSIKDISKAKVFKNVSISVLVIGIVATLFNFKPIEVIKFAQFANGLILPSIAIFLVWIMNKSEILKSYTNSRLQNIFGIFIILITILLGMKSIINVINPL